MVWGVRCYLVGSVMLGALGVLAGCSGGFFGAERDAWRHEAEVACLASGAVRESAGIVRISPINGPGMCGADFPLKVAVLGEGGSLGYSDELRPPGTIPNASQQPRWPVASGPIRAVRATAPFRSIRRTRRSAPGQAPSEYDYRKPYGAAPTRRSGNVREPPPGSYDMSPVPYERRRVIDARAAAPRVESTSSVSRGAVRSEPLPPQGPGQREPDAPLPSLGPSRGPQIPAAVATPVTVSPAATLACPIVSELDRWLANSVQPAAMRWFGSPVAEIKQISAYSCRGMNGNPNAHISEHAFGNALDIAAFTLADGRKITVKNGWRGLPEEQGFLRDVQGAACEQFTTVLAPGSNVYHYDHIHVDLMKRSNGYRACNPHAVSGEEVAARASGGRYVGRRGGRGHRLGRAAPHAAVTAALAQSRRRPAHQGIADGRAGQRRSGQLTRLLAKSFSARDRPRGRPAPQFRPHMKSAPAAGEGRN